MPTNLQIQYCYFLSVTNSICEKESVLGYTTVNKFKPLDDILAGKNVVLAEPDRILI
jgi:hypothetical protein